MYTWLVTCCLLTLLPLMPYIIRMYLLLLFTWPSKNNNLIYCSVHRVCLSSPQSSCSSFSKPLLLLLLTPCLCLRQLRPTDTVPSDNRRNPPICCMARHQNAHDERSSAAVFDYNTHQSTDQSQNSKFSHQMDPSAGAFSLRTNTTWILPNNPGPANPMMQARLYLAACQTHAQPNATMCA